MNRILFVDDESSILSGLRRMLRPYRKEWDMAFAESGEEALQLISENPFDVVVSDMKMPGMDGVELLTKVKALNPDSIRIALSGHAEMEMLLESVQVTHQFLAKPSDAEHIRNVISQALALRDMLNDDKLRACISNIEMLPSLPDLYTRVTAIAASPEGTLRDIGQVVAEDISMSAKILQMVNSAFFGLAREISSPEEATTILGLDVVRSLILSVKIFSSCEQASKILDLKKLNDHCHQVGMLAKAIAKQEGMSKKACDFSLMAGMMHDIGKLILTTAYPEQSAKIYQNEASPAEWQSETNIFGISHAQIGAYLLGVWNLPNPVVEAVAYHHMPEKAIDHPFSPLSATHIANLLVNEHRDKLQGTENNMDVDYISRFADENKLNQWRVLASKILEEAE